METKNNKLKQTYIKKIRPFLGIIIVLGLFIYTTILSIKKNKNSVSYTVGTIINYETKGSKIYLIYEYVVNGKKYTKCNNVGIKNDYFEILKNKKLLVVYNKKYPQKSYLLLNSSMYKQLNLNFPDSLKWLDEYK